MQSRATWKVVTIGAALTGLGVLGAGTAAAAALPATLAAPTAVEAPVDFVAMGDDWTDTYWDDDWHSPHWGADWTQTDD